MKKKKHLAASKNRCWVSGGVKNADRKGYSISINKKAGRKGNSFANSGKNRERCFRRQDILRTCEFIKPRCNDEKEGVTRGSTTPGSNNKIYSNGDD